MPRSLRNFQIALGAMSFSEKQENLTKEEWMERLHDMRVTRADMNRLIMNYLVTGTERMRSVKKVKLHSKSNFVEETRTFDTFVC